MGAGYFGACRTHWDKTLIGFTVDGEWAFERYRYKATDSGKGVNILRRGTDGKWRVAVDS